jgi:uncharacterized membrane protein YfcA
MPPPDLFSPELALAAGIIVIAGLMRGFTGFGSAMVLSPLYSLIYGPVQAVATVMLLESLVTLQLLPAVVSSTRWREIGPMGLVACVMIPLGGFILLAADPDIMRRVIGGAVLVFVLIMLRGWRYHGPRRLPISLGVAAVSGTMVSSVGIGGPPVLLYWLSGPDAAQQNRANIISYFAIISIGVLATFVINGTIVIETVWRAAVLAPFFLISAHVGSRLFRRSSEALYRRVALYFLLAVAITTLAA